MQRDRGDTFSKLVERQSERGRKGNTEIGKEARAFQTQG